MARFPIKVVFYSHGSLILSGCHSSDGSLNLLGFLVTYGSLISLD